MAYTETVDIDRVETVVTNSGLLLKYFVLNDLVFFRLDWLILAIMGNPDLDAESHITAMKTYFAKIEADIYCADDVFYVHENLLPNCLEYLYILIVRPELAQTTRPFIHSKNFDKREIDQWQNEIVKQVSGKSISISKEILSKRYGVERMLTHVIYEQRSHYRDPASCSFFIEAADSQMRDLANEEQQILQKQIKKREKRVLQREKKARAKSSADAFMQRLRENGINFRKVIE